MLGQYRIPYSSQTVCLDERVLVHQKHSRLLSASLSYTRSRKSYILVVSTRRVRAGRAVQAREARVIGPRTLMYSSYNTTLANYTYCRCLPLRYSTHCWHSIEYLQSMKDGEKLIVKLTSLPIISQLTRLVSEVCESSSSNVPRPRSSSVTVADASRELSHINSITIKSPTHIQLSYSVAVVNIHCHQSGPSDG